MDAPNSLVLAIIGITIMLAGYFLYAKFLAKKVYKVNAEFKTPAHQYNDGVDYVPTNRYVLWGHHFTSVAGAAPIVGPAIAVIWGWLPALIWVVLGTVFIAGMHDFGALWASARNRGNSIGTLSGRYIGPRGRNLFIVVVFLLLLMTVAAFGVVISNLLVAQPGAVIPVWGALVVAVIVGQLMYRLKVNLAAVTIGAVAALYALILWGNAVPIELPEQVLGMNPNGQWIVLLFIYAGIASLLPVWVLLQPRDYINGVQLFIGLGIIYGAVMIATPTVVAPAFNENVPADAPSMIPILFVTIACGAISGFHGTVATGTTSKQLDRETDGKFVGYFGAVGEGLLALGAIMATTAGFQSLSQWEETYESFSSGGVPVFVEGGANIVNQGLGVPDGLAATILATMAVLFAATTMDTGVRLMRYVVQEAGELAKVNVSAVVSTVVVVGITLALTFSQGSDGSGGLLIWPLFGTTNQLLAALTMGIITVMLIRKRRPFLPVLIPMVFVLVVSLYAALVQVVGFFEDGEWLLFSLNVIILVAGTWVMVESIIAMIAARKGAKEPEDDVLLTEDEKMPLK